MQKGFWKFERSFLDDRLWRNPNTGRVWLYLMTEATHKPYRAVFGGREITLQPGQALVRRAAIAKNYQLNPASVTTALATLAATPGQLSISLESDGVSYLVTMGCWDSTQAETRGTNSSPTLPPTLPPTAHQLSTNSLHTNKKEEVLEREGDCAENGEKTPLLQGPGENAEPAGMAPAPLIAEGWEWEQVRALRERLAALPDPGFDYTAEEWEAAWRNLMQSRCPVTGYPKVGRNRLATDPTLAMADQCEFLRRVRPPAASVAQANGSPAASPAAGGSRAFWQIERDLKAQWAALQDHPGNPQSGMASPSQAERTEFREKRNALEKMAREEGVKL